MRNAMKTTSRIALAAAFLGVGAASAIAQDPGSRPSREFAQTAASSDQFEIMEAETVLAQSTNPAIRAFATRLIQDHRQLSQALSDAAVRSGLRPPDMAMSADQAQWLGALQSADGQEFERLFLRHQKLAHQSALVVEQSFAKSGQDSELRQFAARAIPQLSMHGDMVSQLEAKLAGR